MVVFLWFAAVEKCRRGTRRVKRTENAREDHAGPPFLAVLFHMPRNARICILCPQKGMRGKTRAYAGSPAGKGDMYGC